MNKEDAIARVMQPGCGYFLTYCLALLCSVFLGSLPCMPRCLGDLGGKK